MTDPQLLRRYASSHDQAAFAELVRRHIDWVYSACCRLTRDPELAQDVTQAVFLILARKAGSISDATSIPGWLFNTARYAGTSALKIERRRRKHEHEAAAMRPQSTDDNPSLTWEKIEPSLDDALARLPAADREIVLLRYYRGLSHHDVAQSLHISEAAAQKRISRALERLRLKLHTSPAFSSTAFATLLTQNIMHAAPPALTQLSIPAAGALTAAKIEIIIKGVFLMQKLTAAKWIAAAVLLLFGTTSVVLIAEHHYAAAPPAKNSPSAPTDFADLPTPDLTNVEAFSGEGFTDGQPTSAIITRDLGAIKQQTYPYGKVTIYLKGSEEWGYREDSPVVIHKKTRSSSLDGFSRMRSELQNWKNASPVAEPAENKMIDDVSCLAFRVPQDHPGGELDQPNELLWIDPATGRVLALEQQNPQLAKSPLELHFNYAPKNAPDFLTLPHERTGQIVDAATFLQNRYPLDRAVFTSTAAGLTFVIHEIHPDPTGIYLIVCSTRPAAAYADALKNEPDDTQLGGFVIKRISTTGESLPFTTIDLGSMEQSGRQVKYLLAVPIKNAAPANHCQFTAYLTAGGKLLELLKKDNVSAKAIIPVDLIVKPESSPQTSQQFASDAYDAIAPLIGLLNNTNLTGSQWHGSGITPKAEYLDAIETKLLPLRSTNADTP